MAVSGAACQRTAEESAPGPPIPSSSPVSPLLTTELWTGLDGYPGGISLRTVAEDGTDLLLKHNNAEIVYAYSLGDGQLRSVSVDTWNNAAGRVVDCNDQVARDPGRVRIDRETNKLSIDSKEVSGIEGAVHLGFQFTSKGDKFAVLSANGKKVGSLSPFLGQGGASGTHYTQVFSYPGIVPAGSAVELPFTTETVTFQGCWSFDEGFIVYSDAIHSQLVIVPVR